MDALILDLKKVNTFVKVVETRSFAHAAEALSYSPAAVTVQIQTLEKELGVVLLDRFSKKLCLTNQGVQFYTYAKELLRLNEEAVDAFYQEGGPLTGHLRVGTISSLCSCMFPELLKKVHDSCPRLTMSVAADTTAMLYQKLACNELDIVIALDEPLARPDFTTVFSMPTRAGFCAARCHPLADRERVELEELLACPCILTEKGASCRRVLDKELARRGLDIQPVLEADNIDLILAMLRGGGEYSLLPLILLPLKGDSGDIVPLSVEGMDLYVQMQIFHNKNKYVSREMERFLSVAKLHIYQLFQKHLAAPVGGGS